MTGFERAQGPTADGLATSSPEELAERFETRLTGLTAAEAEARLRTAGPNAVRAGGHPLLRIAAHQLANPLLGLLLAATAVSFAVGERTDAIIIVSIIVLSLGLGFFDEYRADQAARLLESRVTHRATVLRGGEAVRIAAQSVVPGDILLVETGDIVAADGRLVAVFGLEVDEASITGESLPAEKAAAVPAGGDPASALLFAGTTVRAGRGTAIVVATGSSTAMGGIQTSVRAAPGVTEFQRGLSRFSLFLVGVTGALMAFIFLANAVLGHGLLASLLFSLAIAVGLTPQLLPAIVTVSLAVGGRRLAAKGVIIRHLVAIEDLGNLEVLFSDKTGTLTSGTVVLEAVSASDGGEPDLLAWASAWLAAGAHGASNPLDAALATNERVRAALAGRQGWTVADAMPFDFHRRASAVLWADPSGVRTVVVKGAAEGILSASVAGPAWGADWRAAAEAELTRFLNEGARVIAIATRADSGGALEAQSSEGLTFVGLLAFSDPPKAEARKAIDRLEALGIELKVLTGDHPAVATHVCEIVHIPVKGIATGSELEGLSDAELTDLVAHTTIFARVTPDQKAALVRAAQRSGRDVGFLGDGVNDAPAIHQADVGISVDDATDVAKAVADVVLLEKDLDVLADGVLEGRRTFANTIKYVLMATSSNFGNMFSAAGASLFLSFLPMLPTQILLNNFLYDVSELTLPTDEVDEEIIRRPAHWDIHMISRFMLVFGPASSLYDFLTFALMIKVFGADEHLFQAGWFVESFCTQTLVIFVLRTRRVPFWRSRPSRPLLVVTLLMVGLAISMPYLPVNDALNFEPPPWRFLLALGAMVATYLTVVEFAKRQFYRRWPSFMA